MQAFKAGEVQLLVATTVIEVGVDVPNAGLMIIKNPARLGMAQLHQLHGRVGRGAIASHCVLLYKSQLSKTAHDRNDGFVIASETWKFAAQARCWTPAKPAMLNSGARICGAIRR